MSPIPRTPETEALSRRLIWFEEPAEALMYPMRLMAYALESGTHEDITILRRYMSDDAIRDVLRTAPPGIIRPRSWAYWHARMGMGATPAPPERILPPLGWAER